MKVILSHTVQHKHLPLQTVLIDTLYLGKDLMLFIESSEEHYYYFTKDNL